MSALRFQKGFGRPVAETLRVGIVGELPAGLSARLDAMPGLQRYDNYKVWQLETYIGEGRLDFGLVWPEGNDTLLAGDQALPLLLYTRRQGPDRGKEGLLAVLEGFADSLLQVRLAGAGLPADFARPLGIEERHAGDALRQGMGTTAHILVYWLAIWAFLGVANAVVLAKRQAPLGKNAAFAVACVGLLAALSAQSAVLAFGAFSGQVPAFVSLIIKKSLGSAYAFSYGMVGVIGNAYLLAVLLLALTRRCTGDMATYGWMGWAWGLCVLILAPAYFIVQDGGGWLWLPFFGNWANQYDVLSGTLERQTATFFAPILSMFIAFALQRLILRPK